MARWLLYREEDADDAVQEASLRALRYFHTFVGGNGRAWFLRIVRNVCSHHHVAIPGSPAEPFDEEQHSGDHVQGDPERALIQNDHAILVNRAINKLPVRSRELLRLRELDGLSYRELADAVGIPIGTVMSGLSRARQAFRGAVEDEITPVSQRPSLPPLGARRPDLPLIASSHRDAGRCKETI